MSVDIVALSKRVVNILTAIGRVQPDCTPEEIICRSIRQVIYDELMHLGIGTQPKVEYAGDGEFHIELTDNLYPESRDTWVTHRYGLILDASVLKKRLDEHSAKYLFAPSELVVADKPQRNYGLAYRKPFGPASFDSVVNGSKWIAHLFKQAKQDDWTELRFNSEISPEKPIW